MKRSFHIFIVMVCGILLLFPNCGPGKEKAPGSESQGKIENKQAAKPAPKLILTIVIDQLRADIVEKMQHRFGQGGFRYMIENGTWFKDARYGYCTTLTAVGHATIYTGAIPADHGIVGNYWFDRTTGKIQKTVNKPDPNDKTKTIKGPFQTTASTIGDQLVQSNNGKSRVFSVSLKDRGAILPGGQKGKAFWYKWREGVFTTSGYYYKSGSLPQWLTEWNKEKKALGYKDKKWTLFHPNKNDYIYGKSDDREEEIKYNKKPGTDEILRTHVFPHDFSKTPEPADFYSELAYTPYGDELTYDIAVHLMKNEKVGLGENTDMMAISFSATDVIGHAYGPCSLEYEDNLLHLDALLAKLFSHVDKTVGLKNTLIVVTSDHGTDMIPEYAKNKLGKPAGRLDPEQFTTAIDNALAKKFKLEEKHKIDPGKNFTLGFRNPSIFLNIKKEAWKDFNKEEIEREAAKAVETVDGVAMAVTYSDMQQGRMVKSNLAFSLKAVFHPERSGEVLVVQKQNWFLYHNVKADSAMHGSPYRYDSHVPLFFAGPGITAKTVERRVSPRDIAATLAKILGIEKPSKCSGKPLPEVL